MNRIENVRLYLFARFNEFFKIEFKKKMNKTSVQTVRLYIQYERHQFKRKIIAIATLK